MNSTGSGTNSQRVLKLVNVFRFSIIPSVVNVFVTDLTVFVALGVGKDAGRVNMSSISS